MQGHHGNKPLGLQKWGLSRRPTTFSRNTTPVTETKEITSNQNLRGAGIMTKMGEIQRKAHRPTRSLANPENIITIGYWYVRTMY